jgi:hypothetical protein
MASLDDGSGKLMAQDYGRINRIIPECVVQYVPVRPTNPAKRDLHFDLALSACRFVAVDQAHVTDAKRVFGTSFIVWVIASENQLRFRNCPIWATLPPIRPSGPLPFLGLLLLS